MRYYRDRKQVQKRATKLAIKLRNKPYRDRLFHLNLSTLKYKRLRGDMIEVFKLTHNIYDAILNILKVDSIAIGLVKKLFLILTLS